MQTNFVSSALHGSMHTRPFAMNAAGEVLTGCGPWGHGSRTCLSLTHVQNPLPWCGDSIAKESPITGWAQRTDGWPRGFGVRFCLCQAYRYVSDSSCDRDKEHPMLGLFGGDRKCA